MRRKNHPARCSSRTRRAGAEPADAGCGAPPAGPRLGRGKYPGRRPVHRAGRSTPPEFRGGCSNTRTRGPPLVGAEPPAHRRQGACSDTAPLPPCPRCFRYPQYAPSRCRGSHPNPGPESPSQQSGVPPRPGARDPNPPRAGRRACRRGAP